MGAGPGRLEAGLCGMLVVAGQTCCNAGCQLCPPATLGGAPLRRRVVSPAPLQLASSVTHCDCLVDCARCPSRRFLLATNTPSLPFCLRRRLVDMGLKEVLEEAAAAAAGGGGSPEENKGGSGGAAGGEQKKSAKRQKQEEAAAGTRQITSFFAAAAVPAAPADSS